MQQINITSPIIKMPFGKHKGKVFWTLGKGYFSWLSQQQITTATETAIEEAITLYDNQGSFAVMKRSKANKYITRLETILQSERMANARIDEGDKDWDYFVYPIQDRTDEPPKKPKGYFPSADDYFYTPKN